MPDKELCFSVRGVVLRCTDVGETDRMLTVLTAGSLSACQPFAYADFTLRRGRDYCYLRESTTIEIFHGICDSLSGQALAVYLCEIAEEMSYPGGAAGALLQLTLNTLWSISDGKKPEYLIKGAFELRAAAIDGYMPDLRTCCVCGKTDVVRQLSISIQQTPVTETTQPISRAGGRSSS